MFTRNPAPSLPHGGLHFTDRLLQSIEDRGVETLAVTLHVGAGTFLPVKADNTKRNARRVGFDRRRKRRGHQQGQGSGRTTRGLRHDMPGAVESAADDEGAIHPFEGNTDIFITPGYRSKIVDRLMTNFPCRASTLFMLVSACGLDRRVGLRPRH